MKTWKPMDKIILAVLINNNKKVLFIYRIINVDLVL